MFQEQIAGEALAEEGGMDALTMCYKRQTQKTHSRWRDGSGEREREETRRYEHNSYVIH